MKPRTIVLTTTLALLAACSGKNVLLGSANLTRGGTGGAADSGGVDSGGSGETTLGGNPTAGTLNVGGDNTPVPCAPDSPTELSGTVWDPGMHTPLYNAVVYVPADPNLPAFEDQVACERCGSKLPARAVTLSDAAGSFLLDDGVPNTPEVNLVVQVGKWRREQSVKITPCQPNAIDKEYTRLPQSKTDGLNGHADIPKIALSTGHSDALECLLRKIGIADSEFTTDAGDGRVNMFVGCINDTTMHYGANHFVDGTPFPSTNQLFDTPNELDQYDVVIFSCEGHKCSDTQDSPAPIQTAAHVAQLVDFTNHGGRVYLDHDHYNWLNHIDGDELQDAADFGSSKSNIPSPQVANINTVGFPKGQAFADWLVHVGASTTAGSLDIFSGKTSVQNIFAPAQSWIYQTGMYADFYYFTIGTPFKLASDTSSSSSSGAGGEGGASGANDSAACGRVVFTDLHVSKSGGGCDATTTTCGETDDISDQDTPFPSGCKSAGLLPQERALEFMIFDLTSCVQKETDPPAPPEVVK